jgi:hypothetical protein
MRGLKKVVLLAIVMAAAAGACGRAERLTAPDERAPAADLAPLPDTGGLLPRDEAPPPAPADTTGRWGGGLGSGT